MLRPCNSDLEELIQQGYRFALSLTNDTTRAEDLVQDSWAAVLRVRGPWSRRYLFATIRNRFIDDYRRKKIPTIGYLDDCAVKEQVRWDGDDTGESSEFNSDETMKEALSSIRAEERAALFLAVVEGYTAQYIADLFDWPRGTVLSHLHRARSKIKKHFSELADK